MAHNTVGGRSSSFSPNITIKINYQPTRASLFRCCHFFPSSSSSVLNCSVSAFKFYLPERRQTSLCLLLSIIYFFYAMALFNCTVLHFFFLSSSFCLLNSSRDPSQWTENIFRRMPFNRHVIIGSEFAPCQNKWLYCCLYTQFVYYYLDLGAYSMLTRFFNATYDAIIMGFN